jgi:phage virion morphogenesis protein
MAVIEREIRGLDAAMAMINRMGSPRLAHDGLEQLGGLIENQSKARFSERAAPDGTPWAPWSAAYAKTRHGGHSLLVGDGHLRDSIAWQMDGDELHVGSNLVYAAIHQFGWGEAQGAVQVREHESTNLFGKTVAPFSVPAHERNPNMPAREYMGLSDANVSEAEQALAEWVGGRLQ